MREPEAEIEGMRPVATSFVKTSKGERLQPRERLFVSHYLQSLNATQAAHKAGYASPYNRGPQLARSPKIRAYIEKELAKLAMSPAEIIARLTIMASADMSDFLQVDEGGFARVDLKKAQQAGKLGLIKKIRYTPDGRPEVELVSQLEALEKLAKVLGMFQDVQINHQVNQTVINQQLVVQQVMSRAMVDPVLLEQLGNVAEQVQQRVQAAAEGEGVELDVLPEVAEAVSTQGHQGS